MNSAPMPKNVAKPAVHDCGCGGHAMPTTAVPGASDTFKGIGHNQDEHLGFKKLESKLSHEKGISDPAGLAASIGRKKFGTKKFEHKAEAGRK